MKFKINNKNWEIKEVSQDKIRETLKIHNDSVQDFGKYFGLTYMDTQEIFIDKDLCEDRKRSTLLHELGHCYINTYITHQDRTYNEEDVVDIISNSHDIIRNIVDKYFEVKHEYKSKHK